MLTVYCDDFDFKDLSAAFEGEFESDCAVSAEIAFVGEDEIRDLNARLRGIDAVTDVLSFPALDGIRGKKLKKSDYPADIDENGALFLGSIAICVKRAKEQAEEYGHGYRRELLYLAAHGLFHLLGYDHMTESDKAQMREREESVLKKAGAER